MAAADIFSKWLGESEQRVKELFEQARESVPAINSVVNTFLAEMEGIASTERIFVIGATNRPDLLDEAVLRPGRLSESVEIGLPDAAARLALLQLSTGKMRLDPSVDLAAGGQEPAVTSVDFDGTLSELFPETAWASEVRSIGFQVE